MISTAQVFTNELGNKISMSAIQTPSGIQINAVGPHSETDHVWTPLEAVALRDMLIALEIDLSPESYTGPDE